MSYSVEAVANRFLDLAFAAGSTDVTPMKLQKLVYNAHGWYLGVLGEPLINDEFEAWQFGPVVGDLYREFQKFGDSPIDEKAKRLTGDMKMFEPSLDDFANPKNAKDCIQAVWDKYKDLSGGQLSTLSHVKGGPWDTVSKQYPGSMPYGLNIPNIIIQRYFEGELSKDAN